MNVACLKARSRSRRRSLSAIGLAVLLASGCGGSPGGEVIQGGRPGEAAQDEVPQGCPQLPPPRGEALSRDEVPTAVLECMADVEIVPGDGEWSTAVRRRAIGGLPALVAALRLPSQPRTDGACTMELRMPVLVQLEVGGERVRVATPRDPCGKTRPEVVHAYQALSWQTQGRTRVTRLRPEAAVKAGCEPWKDMVASTAHEARTAGPGDVFAGFRTVGVCRYRSNYPAGWVDDGRSTIAGTPESGEVLGIAASAEVVKLLAAAGPAAECGRPHRRFAVLERGGGTEVYVELDGCLRILAPDNTLRQGDARLASLLDGR